MKLASFLAISAAAAAIACLPRAASAEDGNYYGLLRSRDLTPFGFLRLDLRPAYAIAIEPGSWAVEAELGFQNTWALSPEVEKHLESIESERRHNLGPEDVAAIQALPGENYLVDMESGQLELTFHYKFSEFLTGYLTATAVSYEGGFLDGLIEEFHDTFSFDSFGRPAVSQNDVNVIYDLKDMQLAFFDAPIDGGLTDPIFGMRYEGSTTPGKWQMTLEAAVKVPVDGRRNFLSTGRTDYGAQASFQRFGDHHAWYFDVAAVKYTGAAAPIPQESRVVPTVIVGYERQLTGNTNLNLQAYASESVYTHKTTDLDELLERKYQLSIGLRHRIRKTLLSFAITENVQNLGNTPDIGFHLGVAYAPHPLMRTGE
jgi:Protein of unknown function (DUF3187)